MEGGFEEILQSVLSDPGKMQQIMGLAQSLGGSFGSPESTGPEPEQPTAQLPNPEGLQLTGLLKQAEIDSHQQALLTALTPYMSQNRVQKLRRAMQAARMAELAQSVLQQTREPGG